MKIELKQVELDDIAEEILGTYSDPHHISDFSFIKFYDDYDVEVFIEVETRYREERGGDYDERIIEVDSNRITIKDIIIHTDNEDDKYDKSAIIRQLDKMIRR